MSHDPIVMWQPIATDSELVPPMLVLHPEVPLSKYKFSYDSANGQAVATTPSMTLTSMSLNGDFYQEELAALQSWYANPIVMEKYADGKTRTHEQTEARYKLLADRWTAGFPYSGLMARNADNEIVAMFNFGYAVDDENKVRKGVTEFAAVVNPENWNQGLASEAMILMLFVVKYLSDNGYQIADLPLNTVTTAARTDNWADRVLQKSALTFRGNKELYGATRNVYESSVSELTSVIDNTERSQQENGNFFPSPKL